MIADPLLMPAARPPEGPSTLEGLKETISASRLTTFQQCRLKFYFRYVLGLVKPKSSALFLGSVVHSILQAWNLSRWRNGQVDMEKLKNLFETNWVTEQKDMAIDWEGEEEIQKNASWNLLTTYFRDSPIQMEEKPEAVEVFVEASLEEHGLPRLIGFIDLVRQGGRVVDFKTCAQTPNSEKAVHLNETQLCCYSLLYRESTGKKESGLELHHLVKLKTPKIVVTSMSPMKPGQQTRLFRLMESYLRALDHDDWIPSPNTMSCSCCEYFNECREWH